MDFERPHKPGPDDLGISSPEVMPVPEELKEELRAFFTEAIKGDISSLIGSKRKGGSSESVIVFTLNSREKTKAALDRYLVVFERNLSVFPEKQTEIQAMIDKAKDFLTKL